jgi:hypothetical protein
LREANSRERTASRTLVLASPHHCGECGADGRKSFHDEGVENKHGSHALPRDSSFTLDTETDLGKLIHDVELRIAAMIAGDISVDAKWRPLLAVIVLVTALLSSALPRAVPRQDLPARFELIA